MEDNFGEIGSSRDMKRFLRLTFVITVAIGVSVIIGIIILMACIACCAFRRQRKILQHRMELQRAYVLAEQKKKEMMRKREDDAEQAELERQHAELVEQERLSKLSPLTRVQEAAKSKSPRSATSPRGRGLSPRSTKSPRSHRSPRSEARSPRRSKTPRRHKTPRKHHGQTPRGKNGVPTPRREHLALAVADMLEGTTGILPDVHNSEPIVVLDELDVEKATRECEDRDDGNNVTNVEETDERGVQSEVVDEKLLQQDEQQEGEAQHAREAAQQQQQQQQEQQQQEQQEAQPQEGDDYSSESSILDEDLLDINKEFAELDDIGNDTPDLGDVTQQNDVVSPKSSVTNVLQDMNDWAEIEATLDDGLASDNFTIVAEHEPELPQNVLDSTAESVSLPNEDDEDDLENVLFTMERTRSQSRANLTKEQAAKAAQWALKQSGYVASAEPVDDVSNKNGAKNDNKNNNNNNNNNNNSVHDDDDLDSMLFNMERKRSESNAKLSKAQAMKAAQLALQQVGWDATSDNK